MPSVAGPSSGSSADRTPKNHMTRIASKSKTNKRIEQERILDRLLAAFSHEFESATSSRPRSTSIAVQKSKAIQVVDKDSWSPADSDVVADAVRGLSLKHSIHLDHELSLALKRCYAELLVSCDRSMRLADQARDAQKRRGLDARNVLDPLIRPDNVSDAVRLLLQLSKPADVTARTAANLMLNATQASRAQYLTPAQRKHAEKREWLSILVEEPLEGDAWDEVDTDQDNSDLSDWSVDSGDEHRLRIEEGYDSDKEVRKRRNRLNAVSASLRPSASTKASLQERGQWTKDRQLRDHALNDAINRSIRPSEVDTETESVALSEADAVRESLYALMGFATTLFRATSSGAMVLSDVALNGRFPALANLSEQLQQTLTLASTFASLRSFVKSTVAQSINAVDALTRTPAVEAFAEQLQNLLERLTSRLSEFDADVAVAKMSMQPANICADRYATLTQLLEFVYREASSILLLARLLRAMGHIKMPEAQAKEDAQVVGRAYSDRALIDGLQSLLNFVHQQSEVAHADAILADLSTCLLAACRPAWRSACHLIQRGLSFAITRDHDPLFDDRLVQHMIRHDTSIPTSDSSFWTSGYEVRSTSSEMAGEDGSEDNYSPPAFLRSIMQDVLTTAKGVGLLRSLGIDALGQVRPNIDLDHILDLHRTSFLMNPNSTESQSEGVVAAVEEGSIVDDGANDSTIDHVPTRMTPAEAQQRLRQALFPGHDQRAEGKKISAPETSVPMPQTPLSQPDEEMLWHVGTADRSRRASHRLLEPTLGRSLQEHLSPISAIVRKRLVEVLTSPGSEGGYALQSHLRACHGLFLMQRGAEMSSWLESLFIGLDRRNGTVRAIQHHRLNSGFHDTLEAYQLRSNRDAWIDTNLVRFSTTDDEHESAAAIRQRPRLRRLSDILVEYEVPWPLTFVFPLTCMRFYQTMFTSLLQARYAQWKLSSTIKLAKPETIHLREFWAVRRQAQWLVRTLIEYLQTDVVLDGSDQLCSDLEGPVSLDSAIQIHIKALERMETLSFQRIDQTKVKELIEAAWRIGVDVVSSYERFIGASSREEDRLAKQKRRERRKRRKDRAKRDGAPLGVITEADEEEEEEEEEEEDEQEEDEDTGAEVENLDGGQYDTLGQSAAGRVDSASALDLTIADASMSADVSASWMESEANKHEHFQMECERHRKALDRLFEELKVAIDEQIGRIAAKAAAQAQHAAEADRALQEYHYLGEKWQALLYALAWSNSAY